MAAGGIGLAIAIGVLIGFVAPTEIDTMANTQITARANPTLLDLITALAAGAAGAYGLSRPDVSDALPGVTFVLTGVTPLARLTDQQQRLRTWSTTVAVVAVAVIGALAINGAEIARNSFEQSRIEEVVAGWVASAEQFTAPDVRIDGDTVTVVIVGPNDGRPPAQGLADRLADDLDRDLSIVVRHVVEQRDTATGTAPGH